MTATSLAAMHAALRTEMLRSYPREAAAVLDGADRAESAEVISFEEPAVAADVLRAMAPPAAATVLGALDDESLRKVTLAMDVDSLARLLGRLDDDVLLQRLDQVAPGVAAEVRMIVSYPPTQAGSMMDTRFVAFPPQTTAEAALSEVRARAARTRDIFVVDPENRVLGAVPVEELAIAPAHVRLGELRSRDPLSIEATAPVEEVRHQLGELGPHSLPVLDFEGRMVGVIRAPELVEAVELVATADIQKMVGAGSEERALSSPALAVRKRLPWLYINLLTAFVAAAVVGVFEETIARFTALAVLLPVVAGQSGNSGAQALAVSMRGLALRELRASQWRRVALKEVSVGVINGIAIAVVTSAGVFLWAESTGLAVVIGAAMVLSMTVAGLAGTLIPMTLRALGQDPAQSSSIVLTTVTDVVGFLSFLGLATLLSRFI